jgi:hypothetical protein
LVVKTNPLENEVAIRRIDTCVVAIARRMASVRAIGLVESYRSSRGPRQRVVAHLGQTDAAGRLGIHQPAIGAVAVAQHGLFRDVEPQWVEVDLQHIAIEPKRAFGGPWIGLELCRTAVSVDLFLARNLR